VRQDTLWRLRLASVSPLDPDWLCAITVGILAVAALISFLLVGQKAAK